MNKPNFNNEMEKIIKEVNESLEEEAKAKLLLHACCAPCSSTCMERVRDGFETTVYFYNPNITSKDEYSKRAKELERLIDIYNVDSAHDKIGYIEGCYDPGEFTKIAKGYEDCPERGDRCVRCFELRLKNTAEMAKMKGFDYFTTTLTLSPLKDVDLLNKIGYEAAKETGGIKWLPSDFKKDNGYKRSIELSKVYNLYRQDYCGCIYSKLERERAKEEGQNSLGKA